MNILELKKTKISDLTRMAKKFNIDNAGGMRKQELIFRILSCGLKWGHGARGGNNPTQQEEIWLEVSPDASILRQ